MTWLRYLTRLASAQPFASLFRLMEFAKQGLRWGWLSVSFLKRREKEEQREPMRTNSLSAPLHLCVSKKEPDNSSASERCSLRFLLQIQLHHYRRLCRSRRSVCYFTMAMLMIAWLAPSHAAAQTPATSPPSLILVTGAAGTEEYGQHFSAAADQWRQLAKARQWQLVDIDGSEESGGHRSARNFKQPFNKAAPMLRRNYGSYSLVTELRNAAATN